MGKLSFGMLGLSLAFGLFYMGREWEEDELKLKKLVRFLGCLRRYNIQLLACRNPSMLLTGGGIGRKSA